MTSKVGLYIQAKLTLWQRTKGRKNLLLLQRTDFIFLPLILANDLLKRLYAPSSSSLDGTLMSHSGIRIGGHFRHQCTGQWGCPSTAAAKIWFSKCFQYRLKEDTVPFMQHWVLGPRSPPGWSPVPCCLLGVTWKRVQKGTVWSLRHLSHPSTTKFTSVQSPCIQREVPLLPAT